MSRFFEIFSDKRLLSIFAATFFATAAASAPSGGVRPTFAADHAKEHSVERDAHKKAEPGAHTEHGKHEEEEEKSPLEEHLMTFGEVIAEAAEQTFAGGLFKLFEVGPKVLTVYTAYKAGDHVHALSLGAGTIVEVALLTSLIEVLGIPELFFTSAALTAEWSFQVAQAALGTIVSSKAAVLSGETIEEITKERFSPPEAHNASSEPHAPTPEHGAPSEQHKASPVDEK